MKGRGEEKGVNNCGAGEIHLVFSINNIVLVTIEFKTLCHSESASNKFHRRDKENSL